MRLKGRQARLFSDEMVSGATDFQQNRAAHLRATCQINGRIERALAEVRLLLMRSAKL
jgi:hypothetical protein